MKKISLIATIFFAVACNNSDSNAPDGNNGDSLSGTNVTSDSTGRDATGSAGNLGTTPDSNLNRGSTNHSALDSTGNKRDSMLRNK
jgi:hypothetical protein